MQELIKVSQNEKGQQVVSARELYIYLGYESNKFARWAKSKITENDFAIEFQDWAGLDINVQGNEVKDYAISLDFAKRLSMMAKTSKGEEVRNYFIECEKKIQELQAPKELSRKEILLLALESEERAIAAETKILELQPKAEFYDAVTDSKDAIDMSNVAKVLNLGFGRNVLFQKLRELGILMSNNTPYQNQIENGNFRIIETKFNLPNGDTKIYLKTLVMQKGLNYILRKLKQQ